MNEVATAKTKAKAVTVALGRLSPLLAPGVLVGDESVLVWDEGVLFVDESDRP